MKARFPGSCVVCGGDIIPRESEVEIHPTLRGPKGGKKVCHSECLTKSNPLASVRRNGLLSVRSNSNCGCAYGSDCGCGGYRSNPRRYSDEHYALLEQVRHPQLKGRELEESLAAQARADFERERSRGGRRSRR